jgi:MFS family permease
VALATREAPVAPRPYGDGGTAGRGRLLDLKGGAPVLAGIVLLGMAYGTHLTSLPAYLLGQKAVSPAQSSLYFTLFYACLGAGQLVGGRTSDRCAPSLPMGMGLALCALGLVAAPYLHMPVILLPLMASGAGLGMFSTASLAQLNAWAAPGRKGAVSGFYYLIWGVGYFCGPLIADALFAASGRMGLGIQCLGWGMALCLAWLGLHCLLNRGRVRAE